MSTTTISDLTEFEINYFFVSPDSIRKTLTQIGASQVYPCLKQERYIYNIPDDINRVTFQNDITPYLEPGKSQAIIRLLPYGDYLRLRNEGNNTLTLSIKVHATSGRDMSEQKEAESVISEFESVFPLLKEHGFQCKNVQENYREKWQLDNTCSLTIDWWPYLEPYVEIEGDSEEIVRFWGNTLGFTDQEKAGKIGSTFGSVSHMYAITYGIAPQVMLDEEYLTFDHRPEWVNQ